MHTVNDRISTTHRLKSAQPSHDNSLKVIQPITTSSPDSTSCHSSPLRGSQAKSHGSFRSRWIHCSTTRCHRPPRHHPSAQPSHQHASPATSPNRLSFPQSFACSRGQGCSAFRRRGNVPTPRGALGGLRYRGSRSLGPRG